MMGSKSKMPAITASRAELGNVQQPEDDECMDAADHGDDSIYVDASRRLKICPSTVSKIVSKGVVPVLALVVAVLA